MQNIKYILDSRRSKVFDSGLDLHHVIVSSVTYTYLTEE
jgi:hypothetical protein